MKIILSKLPGNSKSLWKAVKIAKNVGYTPIPQNMTLNNVDVSGQNIAECFASFFDKKVGNIVRETVINKFAIFKYSTNTFTLLNVHPMLYCL